jgi:hypothetical protein
MGKVVRSWSFIHCGEREKRPFSTHLKVNESACVPVERFCVKRSQMQPTIFLLGRLAKVACRFHRLYNQSDQFSPSATLVVK